MVAASADYNPHSVETEVLALWRARRLPPIGGVLGPPTGPVTRQLEGGWSAGDFPSLVAHRAVAADVDARCNSLVGRRAAGTLRYDSGRGGPAASTIPALLTALGVWVGGDGKTSWDSEDRTAGVQAIAVRLARNGALVTRDEAFRVCPRCGAPRCPERIVYEEQEGDTYLVRFPMRLRDLTVNALVWVDAPWKLLGASALLVNPEMHYAVAGYRRRDERELVFASTASLERLRSWIPEATFEVVEERPGKTFQGTLYVYPLRHEFPMGGDLAPPAGTILSATDVGESGTGVVPLVPGHGPTDARIAARAGVAGWPLLNPKGMLDVTLMHKYAGLDLETANEFVLRDLSEAGALFAHLRVKRGVPHCAVCGTALLWAPGRAWCLEPSRLPPEIRGTFSRLLPGEAIPGPNDVAPWPVSELTTTEDPNAVALLECARCERLDGPDGPPQCPCGGSRSVVRRPLLASGTRAFSLGARLDPLPDGDPVHIYVNQRRRVPALLHQLAALSAIEGNATNVALTVVPTVAAAEIAELVAQHGADAVRATLVRGEATDGAGGNFADRCRQEADRLRRWWLLAREVAAMCDPASVASFAQPIGGYLIELEVEDRAIVARWERTRVLALARYDESAPAKAYRLVSHFLDNDLIEYHDLVLPRLRLPVPSPARRSALRTLVHLLRGISELLAPIAPFASESIHRSLSADRSSLFERPIPGVDRTLLSDDLAGAWDRWRTVVRSVDRFRRSFGIPLTTELPSVALVLAADDQGERFRAEKETLARLLRAAVVEVGSPREPWAGRQRVLRPIESEIQKAYPTEASQILHLLQRMPARRFEGTAATEGFDVVINGTPRRIFPTMMAFSETLPEGVVPFPWPLGEMYLGLPGGTKSTGAPPLPPLSSDAFWLVRRLRRRLRLFPPAPGARPRVAIVTVKDPLASELRFHSGPIAQHLDLAELRVVERTEGAALPHSLTGRTRTGERWTVYVPDLPKSRRREKHPPPRSRLLRVPALLAPPEVETIDFADEKLVAHEQEVRSLGQELDDIVGIPLLGPAKIAVAWEHGLHSVEDYRHISFDAVAALPGFGGPVAVVVVTKLGGSVPVHEIWRFPGANPPATRPPGPAREPPPPPPPVVLAGANPPKESAATIEAPAPSAPAAHEAPGPVPAPVPAPEIEPPPPPPVASPLPPPTAPEAPVAPEWEAAPEEPPVPAEPMEPAVEPSLPGESPSAPESPGPELPAPTEEVTPPMEPSPSVEERPSEQATPVPEGIPEATDAGTPVPELPPVSPDQTGAVGSIPPPPEEEPEPEVAEAPALPEETPPSEEAPPSAPEIPLPPAETPVEAAPLPTPEAEVEEAPGLREETLPSDGAPPSVAETPIPPPEEPVEVARLPTPEPEVSAPPLPEEAAPAVAPPAPEVAPPQPPTAEILPEVVPEVVPKIVTLPPEESKSSTPIPAGNLPAIEPPTTAPEALPTPPAPEPPAPPRGVELSVGGSLVGALGGFLDSTAAGHRGVCVVRESPERIRARVGSRPIEVLWLTNIGRGPSLRPSDLDGAWSYLTKKLLEEHVTAFFLEGIEYLVRVHGADAVLNGLVQFDRLARENDARVWVYLAPALMNSADFERFRSTFGLAPTSA